MENAMAINKGYLTAKTDKESDETYTPAYAVIPILKHYSIIFRYFVKSNRLNNTALLFYGCLSILGATLFLYRRIK